MRTVFTDRNENFLNPQNRLEPSGFIGWSGEPSLMEIAHQHDDLELNLIAEGGTMLYLFDGVPVEIGSGAVAAFWAAFPHQLIATSATQVHWLHIPFATLLGWGLPGGVLGRLLSGAPLIAPPSAALPTDRLSFTRWADDLRSGRPELSGIALLEIEARVRRMALAADDSSGTRVDVGSPAMSHVITMVRYIATHFHRPITVADVAAAARLHPNYAMTRFRAVMGMTVVDHLNRCRLADARRLLVTTDLPVVDIASATGFGSTSRFYASFTSGCGMPPARYRRAHRVAEPV